MTIENVDDAIDELIENEILVVKPWYTIMVTVEGKDNMMRVNKMLDKWNKNTHGKDECPQCNGKHIIRYIDVAQIESRKMDVHYKL